MGEPVVFIRRLQVHTPLDEFQQLVPPFEAAFQAHMAAWRLDGTPRTARRFTVYQNCPLPTPEDRLFFILLYLKTYALQVVQGASTPSPPSPARGEGGVPTKVDTAIFMQRHEGNAFMTLLLRLHCH